MYLSILLVKYVMLHTLRIELVIPEKINTSVMYINQADPFLFTLIFRDVLNQFVGKYQTDIEVLYHLIHYYGVSWWNKNATCTITLI